jgi:hypothetical protein
VGAKGCLKGLATVVAVIVAARAHRYRPLEKSFDLYTRIGNSNGYVRWIAALLGHLLSGLEEELEERRRLVTLVGVIMRGGAASAPARAAQRVRDERAGCDDEGRLRELKCPQKKCIPKINIQSSNIRRGS